MRAPRNRLAAPHSMKNEMEIQKGVTIREKKSESSRTQKDGKIIKKERKKKKKNDGNIF